MSQKRHTPEQIINKLRQAEVELARGATVPEACKKTGGAFSHATEPLSHH